MKKLMQSWRPLDQQLPGCLTACSYDGSIVVTSTHEGLVRVFVRVNHEFIQKSSWDSTQVMYSLACNKDVSVIVLACERYLYIMKWDGNELQQQFEYASSTKQVSCSGDGKLVVGCTKYLGMKHIQQSCGYAFAYEEQGWKQVWSYDNQDNLELALCSGDGKHIVTGSLGTADDDTTLRIFEESGNYAWHQKIATTAIGYNTFWSMAVNGDGTRIIIGYTTDLSADIFVYDGQTLAQAATVSLPEQTTLGIPSAIVACNYEGSVLALSGGGEGCLGIYTLSPDGSWQQNTEVMLPYYAQFIACSADASLILVGLNDHEEAVHLYQAD